MKKKTLTFVIFFGCWLCGNFIWYVLNHVRIERKKNSTLYLKNKNKNKKTVWYECGEQEHFHSHVVTLMFLTNKQCLCSAVRKN